MHIMATEERHYHETIIRELRSELTGRFNPIAILVDIHHKSIRLRDRQKIKQDCKFDCEVSASSNLLDILARCPIGAFIEFTKALCTHGREDLAQEIYQQVPDQFKSKFSFVLLPVQGPSSMNSFSDASHLEAGAVGGVTPHRIAEITRPDQHDQRDHGLQHSLSASSLPMYRPYPQAERAGAVGGVTPHRIAEITRPDQHDQRYHGLQHSLSASSLPMYRPYPQAERGTIDRLQSEVSNEDNRAYPEPPETPLSEMIQEQSEEMIKVLENNVDYLTVVKKLKRKHYNRVKDFNCFTMLLEELEERGWTIKKLVDEIVMNLDQKLRNQILSILKYPIPSDDKKVLNLDLSNIPSMPRVTSSTMSPSAQHLHCRQLSRTDQDDDRNAVNRDLPNIPSVPQEVASTQSPAARLLSCTQQCQNDQCGLNAHKGPEIEAERMHQDALAEGNGCLTTGLPIPSEADPHSERSSKPPGLEAERLREDTMSASSESQLTRTANGHVNMQFQPPQQFRDLRLQTRSNNRSFVTLGGKQENLNVPLVIGAKNCISGSSKVTLSVAESGTDCSDDVEPPNRFGLSHNNNININVTKEQNQAGCSTTSSTVRSTGEDVVTTGDSVMDFDSASNSSTDGLNPSSAVRQLTIIQSAENSSQSLNEVQKLFLDQNRTGLLDMSSSFSVASTSGENREQLQSSETPFDSEAVKLDSFSQNEITIPKILYEEKTDQNNAQSDVSLGIDQLDDSADEDQTDVNSGKNKAVNFSKNKAVNFSKNKADVNSGKNKADANSGMNQADVNSGKNKAHVNSGKNKADNCDIDQADYDYDIDQADDNYDIDQLADDNYDIDQLADDSVGVIQDDRYDPDDNFDAIQDDHYDPDDNIDVIQDDHYDPDDNIDVIPDDNFDPDDNIDVIPDDNFDPDDNIDVIPDDKFDPDDNIDVIPDDNFDPDDNIDVIPDDNFDPDDNIDQDDHFDPDDNWY